MKTLFTLIAIILLASPSFSQAENPPVKKNLISINSNYYKNASQVVVGVLKQGKVYNFFIEDKLETLPTLNFQFKDKTFDQALELISKIYKISIETNDKKDFYTIILKEKK